MGEIIKVLAEGKVNTSKFEIELNKGSSEDLPRSIHIQNNLFRAEFDEIEFMKLATTYLCAKRRFLALKGDI
jgi:hypothetical protein